MPSPGDCPDQEAGLITPEDARDARRQARLACTGNGVPDDRCDDVVLVLSELLGNAVRHGRPPVTYAVSPDGQDMLVTVEDGDPALPSRATGATGTTGTTGAEPDLPSASSAPADAENGRGLLIVAALSRIWGWRSTSAGKLVWARL